jgi:hypothetical protein
VIPKGGDVLVELVLERICSKKLASCGYQMRQQILPTQLQSPFLETLLLLHICWHGGVAKWLR